MDILIRSKPGVVLYGHQLEAVSDRIELTRDDVEDLLQRQIPGDAQTELRGR